MCRAVYSVGLAMTCMLSTGCVSMVAVTPIPSDKQTLRYYSGAGLISSGGERCAVVFGPLDEVQNLAQHSMFMVSIKNLMPEPVLVNPRDVTATATGSWGRTPKLQVIDRNSQIARLEEQRASDRFSAAMVGLSGAIAASQPATTTGYASNGGAGVMYGSTTYNPAASAQATQQGITNSLMMNAASDARYQDGMASRGRFLAKNTIMPGDTYSAMLAISPPQLGFKPVVATYNVNVCGEAHTFQTSYESYKEGRADTRGAGFTPSY